METPQISGVSKKVNVNSVHKVLSYCWLPMLCDCKVIRVSISIKMYDWPWVTSKRGSGFFLWRTLREIVYFSSIFLYLRSCQLPLKVSNETNKYRHRRIGLTACTLSIDRNLQTTAASRGFSATARLSCSYVQSNRCRTELYRLSISSAVFTLSRCGGLNIGIFFRHD